MAGTKAGGLKAAQKNLAKDPSFYAKIGAKGGRNGHTGGFAANPELARVAGAKGGRISRRTKKTDDSQVIQATQATDDAQVSE
jgi:general stress protein YciG